jgi:hypothetical protein
MTLVNLWVYHSGSHTKELALTLRYDAFQGIKLEHHENQADEMILGRTNPCSELNLFV